MMQAKQISFFDHRRQMWRQRRHYRLIIAGLIAVLIVASCALIARECYWRERVNTLEVVNEAGLG